MMTRVLHIAIANPAHAPYGQAAKQALERAGLWSRVESKLVYGGNVEQALQYARSGNADLVITARSLIPEGQAVDPRLYDPIRQAAAVVKGSKNEAIARRFLECLKLPARAPPFASAAPSDSSSDREPEPEDRWEFDQTVPGDEP